MWKWQLSFVSRISLTSYSMSPLISTRGGGACCQSGNGSGLAISNCKT